MMHTIKKLLVLVLVLIFCFSFLPAKTYAISATSLNSSQQQKRVVKTIKTLQTTPTKVTSTEAASVELGFDVTALGAKGDDTTDDTEAIQNALNQYDNVYIPAGTYMIDVEKSLTLRSNQTLTLDNLAILQALPTTNGNSSVLKIKNVSNVIVSGGQIIGERYSHMGATGEWGMGILIESGANNISISNITISDCWGDGIYLGGTSPVNQITLDNVISSNNRRQGMSITNATQVTVSNSIFKDTNGTAPEAGIDIEPNAGQITEDITIINTQCYGNGGAGLDLMGCNETIQRIIVQGCSFKDNDSSGIRIENAKDLTFSSTSVINNYTGIDIPRDVANVKFMDMTISNNQSRGVSIIGAGQTTGIENIVFENCTIADNSQRAAGWVDGVRIDNWDLTGYIKDITFTSCSFIDDQTVKTQRYGITVGFSEKISNIVIAKNNFFSGNILGNLLGENIVYAEI